MKNRPYRGRSYRLEGAYFFMTFHLKGAIEGEQRKQITHLKSLLDITYDNPQRTSEFQLQVRRKLFRTYENMLEKCDRSSMLLQQYPVARQLRQVIMEEHRKSMDVLAFSILPNHVHIVCEILDDQQGGNPWSDLARRVKSQSARKINEILKTSGSFWDALNYEHPVEDDQVLLRIIRYVVANPVRLGIANVGNAWKWTYVKPEIQEVLSDMHFGKVG